MNRRTLILTVLLYALGTVSALAQGAFDAADYKRALWMTTRFYGGQRSGVGPNWLLMDHTYKTSFTQDADGAYNLEGGWFDCGDHVTFGQTFFYSAYALAKAYDMFPKGFHDLYDGKNYSDYAESGNWDMAGGKPNGFPDVLEELKYATDWIIKATPNSSTFYYQKGNGDLDHKTWVTAGKMSTQPVNDGGEPRSVYKNPGDGIMPSFAAASLAVMSRVYRKFDSTYADLCLTHARSAYEYAQAHKTQSTGAGGYYGAGKDPATSFLIASAEMYKATGEDKYKTDVTGSLGEVKDHFYALDYSNPHDLAPLAIATAIEDQKSAMMDKMKSFFIDDYTSGVNGEKVCTKGNSGWGALRYPANNAFSTALYSTVSSITQYDQFIFNQVDYIMGNNNAKQSFIVGFCESCSKEPKMPHHRNVYLRDDNPDDNAKAQMTIPERNKQFGQLMGGTWSSTSYTESVTQFSMTEGGIDYNAGLVGTLAYIVSKLDPADTSKMTGKVDDPIQSVQFSRKSLAAQGLSIKQQKGAVTFSADKGMGISVNVYDLAGNRVFSSNNSSSMVQWRSASQSRGMYLVKVRMGSGRVVETGMILK